MKGLVTRSTGSFYEVKDTDGQTYTCRLKGRFRLTDKRATNPIAVGDFVDFNLESKGESWVITSIYDRMNYLIRRSNNLSKEYQVIAANVDRIVILASVYRPRTSTGFIDRMLVAAEMFHIPPLILFNKRDIYGDDEMLTARETMDVYAKAGYKTMLVSALDKDDMRDVQNKLRESVSLIAGHSGVGKSTIINALIPGTGQKVAEISDYHHKGTHTTTFAQLFTGEDEMHLIDSPGIKDFGLVFIEANELGGYFPEFRREMSNCKFSNCLHVNEPGCSVLMSVAQGNIAEFRYVNYLNMLEELKAG